MWMKILGGIVATIATIAAILALTYYVGIIGNRVQANYARATVTTKIGQVINQPGFAQATYERFWQECEDVLADNAKIAQGVSRVTQIRAEPDDAFGQKAGRLADAISDVTGLEGLQTQVAADYNAASEEWTRDEFKAVGLPDRLDPPYHLICEGASA